MLNRRALVVVMLAGFAGAAVFLPLWAWQKNQEQIEREGQNLSAALTGVPTSDVSDSSVYFLALGIGSAVVGGVAGLVLLAGGATSNQTPASRDGADTRPCPFCAEPIRRAAVLCRFCGRDVEPIPSVVRILDLGEADPERVKEIVEMLKLSAHMSTDEAFAVLDDVESDRPYLVDFGDDWAGARSLYEALVALGIGCELVI